jgi:hypothetical protein
MSFQILPATRQGVKPLIVPFAESGCGKTMSALLLARGIAGPDGKIILGDSEAGRGSLYADVIPGGFLTFGIEPPFSPSRYIEAIDAIEEAGADVGILDSGSHEWEGISGVLDMAGENEQRSGKPGLHNWKTPKLEHAKFVQRLLRTKIPFIICLRAKYKSRQAKNERGKTEIVKDDFTSPIQAEDFIFEATAHFEIMPDHSIRLTKCSHPDLRKCFPEKGPIEIKHGQLIAQWAAGAAIQNSVSAPAVNSTEARGDAAKELWELVKEKFKTPGNFADFLKREGLIGQSDLLTQISIEKIKELHRILTIQLAKENDAASK